MKLLELDERLCFIHTKLSMALMDDWPDEMSHTFDAVESAEEQLNDLRNELRHPPAPPSAADYNAALKRAIPPERLAEVFAPLPVASQRRVATSCLLEKPVRRSVLIITRKSK